MMKTINNTSNKLFATSVRFSDEQRKNWMRIAEESGCSLAALIRKSVIQSLIEGVPNKQETLTLIRSIDELIDALNHVGNNLNQLTRHAHSTGEISSNIHSLLAEIDILNDEASEALIPLRASEHKKRGQYNPKKDKKDDLKN